MLVADSALERGEDEATAIKEANGVLKSVHQLGAISMAFARVDVVAPIQSRQKSLNRVAVNSV